MSDFEPSAFDDYVEGLDMSWMRPPLRAGPMPTLARRVGALAGNLAGRWAKAPNEHRIMVGYIAGHLLARLIIWHIRRGSK